MVKKLLVDWISFLEKHTGRVAIALLLLTGLSVYGSSQLKIDGNVMDFLPQTMPSVVSFKKVLAKLGGYGNFILIVEGESMDQSLEFAHQLAPKIRALDWVSFVDLETDTSVFEKNKLLYTDLDDLKKIRTRVSHYLAQVKKMAIASKIGFLSKEEAGQDLPAISFDDIEKKYAEKQRLKKFYHDEANKTLMIPVWPRGITSNMDMAGQAMADLERLIAEQKSQAPFVRVNAEIGGEFRNKMDELGAIMADLKRTSVWSTLAILLLITISYLSPLTLVFIIIPLAVGMSWTTAAITLVFGKLNLMTVFLFGILFGLGIEYGIHFYGRYREELKKGVSLHDNLATILQETGYSCWISALATSGAFFSLMLTQFTGIRQFGFIVGCGILLVYVAMVTVFPTLVLLLDRMDFFSKGAFWRKLQDWEEGAGRWVQARVAQFAGKASLVRVVTIVILVGSLSFTAYSIQSIPALEFEHDFNKVDVQGSTFQKLEGKIERVFKESRTPALVLVDSLEEVQGVQEALRLQRQTTPHSTIEGFKSVLDYLPADQDEKLALIGKMRDEILPVKKFMKSRAGSQFEKLYSLLDVRKLGVADLPKNVSRLYVGNEEVPGYLVHIFEAISLRQAKEAIRYADEIRNIRVGEKVWHPGAETLVYVDVLRMMEPEVVRMLLIVMGGILLMLFLQFRNLKDTLLLSLPMLLVMVWILGWMNLFQIKFNAFNLVIFPIILGVNIDNFVYIYCRYQKERGRGVGWAIQVSARSIFVSLLTTMLSFASLASAHHTGLHSVGVIAICGFGSCLLSSLVFFPALLSILHVGSATGEAKIAVDSSPSLYYEAGD